MEKKKYTLPEENVCNKVSEPSVSISQLTELREQLFQRVMNIKSAEKLRSLIVYVDVLQNADTFDEEWKNAVSIEEFRARCKSRLKEMYGL